jgi:hypothetical protein
MNTTRWIGTILMIVGVIAFVVSLLFWGAIIATALGIVLDSIGGGGIRIIGRLVGGTTGPN